MLNKIVKICLLGLLLTSVPGIKSGVPEPPDTSANLEDFEWMAGLWKRESSRGATFEKWIKVSGRTYEGLAYRMKDGAQQVTEHLRLEQFGSEIFYTAKPLQIPIRRPSNWLSSKTRQPFLRTPVTISHKRLFII